MLRHNEWFSSIVAFCLRMRKQILNPNPKFQNPSNQQKAKKGISKNITTVVFIYKTSSIIDQSTGSEWHFYVVVLVHRSIVRTVCIRSNLMDITRYGVVPYNTILWAVYRQLFGALHEAVLLSFFPYFFLVWW